MVCAIAGELAFRGARAETGAVQKMANALGTANDNRIWNNGWVAFDQIPLGNTGASASSQPTYDAEQELAVVFDGHLTNRDELYSELAKDHRFRAGTDAEVILAAYSKWGESFIERLHGEFAIALADLRRHRLLLGRDRLGVKPLYVAHLNGRLRFASTLPGLVASGGIDTSVDRIGLHHYMSWHSIVPAPRSILTGVTKLPPATMHIIDSDGQLSERVYWQPDYSRNHVYANWDEQDWQEAICNALQVAVQRRLDDDTGVLLSGGLDSSLLVALMAEAGQRDIPTFSVGFDSNGQQAGNEFEYSDRIAEEFQTDHHTLHIGSEEFAGAVGDAVAAMMEPMASHDVPAFYLHSQAVVKHSNAVQSGQGADELFAGYRYHQVAESVPRESALAVFEEAFVDHTQHELAQILNPTWLTSTDVSHERLADKLSAPGAETAIDAVLRLETQLLMADDPVKRVSNMSSIAGLEARVPFLDHELVELVAACPIELKTAQGGKGILKDIGRKLLPSEVIDRPKGYFPVPALGHLQDPILTDIREALHAPEAQERDLFRRDYINALLDNPNDQYVPTGGNTLWKLGLLELWLQSHNVG
ncbi:N-acetylglutaminylglutamine amidotransferase [Enteractinococcus fodinae]|uniref:asparagine synthase (glutamine-hydrolyzing) n=1 Tax=Enteractinococcus fodinae TaxID=684663 RepID=A0ABU2AYM7_9MICC|nr:N-acetylglutaminylglutamine amidotransferase [Enteractinococcus fodinae]MDR7345889.1 asparagine synthase (glutamine-hydrolyzing) [Enteractinococcus fodinae]